MSDSYLRITPSDPTYTPAADASRAAEERFRSLLPRAELVVARQSVEVEFVDCGANLEQVLCPRCGHDLLIDAAWQRLMDEAQQSRYRELTAVLPCCGNAASLNDLKYDFPCGFASYVLEARNPGQGFTEQQVAAVAAELGCAVRVIWAHV